MTQDYGDGVYGAGEAPALENRDHELVKMVQAVRTARAEPSEANLKAARDGAEKIVKVVDALEEVAPLPAKDLDNVHRTGKRRWLVPGWIRAGRLSMLTGKGGTGKSFLALGMAAMAGGAAAAEVPDNPILPKPKHVGTQPPRITAGCVVYLSWEDEDEEARRRLDDIEKAYGLEPRQLGKSVKYLYAAHLGPLWAPGEKGNQHVLTLATLTASGQRVRAYCQAVGAKLLILDPVAAVFASDENHRGLVRAFAASWDAWAQQTGCAVLLIAHPPKDTANPYSGSSGWQAAVRSLLTIEFADADGFTGPEPDRWKDRKRLPKKPRGPRLACHKSSYGPIPAPLWLERHDKEHPGRPPEDCGGAWFVADKMQVPVPAAAAGRRRCPGLPRRKGAAMSTDSLDVELVAMARQCWKGDGPAPTPTTADLAQMLTLDGACSLTT